MVLINHRIKNQLRLYQHLGIKLENQISSTVPLNVKTFRNLFRLPDFLCNTADNGSWCYQAPGENGEL